MIKKLALLGLLLLTAVPAFAKYKINIYTGKLDYYQDVGGTITAHSQLTGVGTNTHATIDSKLAQIAIDTTTLGSTSFITDHKNLTSTGTLSHDAIDSRLSALVVSTSSLRTDLTGLQNEVHTLVPSSVTLSVIGDVTDNNLQVYINDTISSGRIYGGVVSDDGTGGVYISSMVGFIKSVECDTAPVSFFKINQGHLTSLTDNALNYLYVDYNSGSPTYAATTDRSSIHESDMFVCGRAYKQGTSIDLVTSGINVSNHIRYNHDRLIARGIERMSGGVIGETGERYLTSTIGTYYLGANKFTTPAIDTSAVGRFTYYRRSGASWVKTSGFQQIDNLNYDNGTSTVALSNNKYGVHWIYICLEGDIYVVYGQGDYTLSEADVAPSPTPPDYLDKFAKLAAKIVILKGGTNFISISSAYATLFPISSIASHSSLSNLDFANAGHTGFASVTDTGTLKAQLLEVQRSTYTQASISLLPTQIASGILPNNVIASSIAVNAVPDSSIITVSGSKVLAGVPTTSIANGQFPNGVKVSSANINATGTPSSSTAYFGDNSWKTITGGGDMLESTWSPIIYGIQYSTHAHVAGQDISLTGGSGAPITIAVASTLTSIHTDTATLRTDLNTVKQSTFSVAAGSGIGITGTTTKTFAVDFGSAPGKVEYSTNTWKATDHNWSGSINGGTSTYFVTMNECLGEVEYGAVISSVTFECDAGTVTGCQIYVSTDAFGGGTAVLSSGVTAAPNLQTGGTISSSAMTIKYLLRIVSTGATGVPIKLKYRIAFRPNR